MNLLVDAHCFDYKTSEGINTYIKGLYQSLIRIAPDIDFYFAANNIEKIKSIFGERKNVHYIKLGDGGKFSRLINEFPKIIKQHKIDFAHFQYISPLIKNCKTIITLHDILFKDFPNLFPLSYRLSKDILFKISALRADMLLTVSEYSKERIAHHYKIKKDKIFITPNAVSKDFFKVSKEEASKFIDHKGVNKYLLYVGRVEPRKNQYTLLRSFIELNLAAKGYDLVLIGRNTIPDDKFNNYYSQLGPSDKTHIHIIEQVEYEELKYWYKCCHLFVFPSLAEGFGIPPLEAGATKRPVICNNATAMKDFHFFGKELTDISTPQMLSPILKKVLDNMPTETQLDEVAHEIENIYNWDKIAENFYDSLKKTTY